MSFSKQLRFATNLSVSLSLMMAATLALSGASYAQTPPRPNAAPPNLVQPSPARRPPISAETKIKERINAWTIGLAAGLLEGAPIHFATDIARVVSAGDDMHVLPIVTRGPTENVNDLLYLRGVDIAIINSDSLEEYKSQVPQIQQRISYILSLFPSELHILVRQDVGSLQDLKGKKVNFNTLGTAAAYSGPLIFSRLGVDVDKTFIPHPAALEQLRRGEMAAVVFVTSKPVDAFVKGKWDGFKFLAVEYDSRFEDYYLPSYLDAADYPNLIPKGERIATIAVPTLLAAYNWRVGSERYGRVARFVDKLFSNVNRLQSSGFQAKWKDVNLSTKVPGLQRFPAAQEWLERANTAKRNE